MCERQKLEVGGERGEGQSEVLAGAGRNQSQSQSGGGFGKGRGPGSSETRSRKQTGGDHRKRGADAGLLRNLSTVARLVSAGGLKGAREAWAPQSTPRRL